MAKIKIIAGGVLKEKAFAELSAEYQKRVTGRVKLEIYDIKEKNWWSEDPVKAMQDFSAQASAKFSDRDELIALDVSGKNITSVELWQMLSKLINAGSTPVFLIGASEGIPADLLKKARHKIAFGGATWPHKLCRVMLLEQIYRALSIGAGEKYHK